MNASDLFEIKRAIRDTLTEVMRSMFKQVIRESKYAIWKCPWCHKENIRINAGADRCFVCGAIVFTEFDGADKIRVKHSQAPRRSEHLDCVATAGCKTAETHYVTPSAPWPRH